jgi:hypothetical protein
MIKATELVDRNSCLNKAGPDEPIFVLRAKDPCAAFVIRIWCYVARFFHEADKVAEARRIAVHMVRWRHKLVDSGGAYTSTRMEVMAAEALRSEFDPHGILKETGKWANPWRMPS